MYEQAFDLDPVLKGHQAVHTATTEFLQQLNGLVMIDTGSGAVKVDAGKAQALLKTLPPNSAAAAYLGGLQRAAEWGMMPSGEDGACIPWAAFANLAQTLQGTPKGLRAMLGIHDPLQDIATQIKTRHPNVPAAMLTPQMASLLAREPLLAPFAPPGGSRFFPLPGPGKDPGGNEGHAGSGSPPPPLPSADDVMAVAQCLLHGKWDAYWGHKFVWTWLLGCSVSIGHDCAQKLATLLMNPAGGSALLATISAIAASNPASISAATVMAAYGFLLGVEIRCVNGPNGVMIHFMWPFPPPLPYLVPFATSL
jgi:hypothetical protein